MARGWMTRSWNDQEHDPEIDKVKTVWQQERLKEKDLAVLAGLAVGTVSRLFARETKRPQNRTLAAMYKAMGYNYTATREAKPVYKDELPLAYEEFKAHKEALKRQRDREARRARANGKKK
jgi:transcriptional regulator with XRE-family HTH domain